MSHANHSVARGVNGRPKLCSNTRENGGTISRAFLGFDDFNFVTVDVGLNLLPQGRARAAAAQTDILHRYVHFVEDRETVFQAKRYALENGAYDMSPRM